MKLPRYIDWHDVLFALACLFVIAQVGACEVKVKASAPVHTEPPAPPATQLPARRVVAC